MSREILFRGKRHDNGEWVYGSLIISGSEAYIMQQEDFNKGYGFGYVDGSPCYPVNFKTVGQYTGLKDRNGKKIFEGDIVKIDSKWFENGLPVKFGKYEIGDFEGYLTYKQWGFFISHGKHSDPDDTDISLLTYKKKELSVIGNIHDNPELLKGENK